MWSTGSLLRAAACGYFAVLLGCGSSASKEDAAADAHDDSQPAPPTATAAPPPERTARQVFGSTDLPATPRPEYLVPTRDPTLGTSLMRIAGVEIAGAGQLLRHSYARNQPWNADGTLIMLDYTYPAAIIDARTLQFLRWIHQPQSAVWSHTDPNTTVGTLPNTNVLVRADMRSDGAVEVLHRFEDYVEISFGAGEGNISNDDRFVALFGFARDSTDLLVFDLSADRIVARLSLGSARVCDCPDPASVNNATMSQSGKFVIVQYNERGVGRSRGIEVFTRDLQFQRQLTAGSEHGDAGLSADGRDLWVSWRDTTGHDALQEASAYAWLMDTGAAIPVIPRGTTLGHISCRNTRRAGVCYASHARTDDPRSPANNLLYAFPLDGSMNIEAIVHQHATCASYERFAMGVPSQDGSSVLWASDWDDPAAPVYAYVARRPDGS
jgi:hypothetical protein